MTALLFGNPFFFVGKRSRLLEDGGVCSSAASCTCSASARLVPACFAATRQERPKLSTSARFLPSAPEHAMSAPVPRDQAAIRFSVRFCWGAPAARAGCAAGCAGICLQSLLTLPVPAAKQLCSNCRVPTELVEDHAAGDLICKVRALCCAGH